MTQHKDEVVLFDAAGSRRQAVLRTPAWLTPNPALLINFGGSCKDSLDDEHCRNVPDIFLAAGHRVAAYDLPGHGGRDKEYGPGLVGMAAAMKEGVDVFGDIRETGRALIDLCINRGAARSGLVVLHGFSRGGLAAMHVMAGNPHVLASAVHAPVIYLPELIEMRDLAGVAVAERSNATALLDALADRPLFMAMGETDPRVGAHHTFHFHAQLLARSRTIPPELFCGPGESHGATFANYAGYNAAAGFLFRWCAGVMKSLPES